MPKLEYAICDICGKGWAPIKYRWEENSNGGKITIVPDGFNGALSFETLCSACRRHIYNNALDTIRNLKIKNTESLARDLP